MKLHDLNTWRKFQQIRQFVSWRHYSLDRERSVVRDQKYKIGILDFESLIFNSWFDT